MRGFFPFGYAQGQNDNQKRRQRQQQLSWVWTVYIRPIAKCAMDGAPVLLWLGDERQRQKQLPCGDDN
jgi:hypothetical protein